MGDGLIRCQESSSHLVEGFGGLIETAHLLGDTLHLFEIIARSVSHLLSLGEGLGRLERADHSAADYSRTGYSGAVSADHHTAGETTLGDGIRVDSDRTTVTADDYTRTGIEIGTILGILAVEHREYLLPGIFFGRTVEGGKDKHCDFSAHTDTEESAATRQVEYLEECTPDHDGCTYRISEIEEALTLLTMKEAFDAISIFTDLYHWNKTLWYYQTYFTLFFLLPRAKPICERTQRKPI